MTAEVFQLPTRAAKCLDQVAQIGFSGTPSKDSLFSEELQEQLLYLLDAEYDGDAMTWLTVIVRVIISSGELDLTPAEALEFWSEEKMDQITLSESEQFA